LNLNSSVRLKSEHRGRAVALAPTQPNTQPQILSDFVFNLSFSFAKAF